MKKTLLAFLFIFLLPLALWAATATDDFERTDDPDLGAAWDPYDSAPCQIVSGNVVYTTPDIRCVEGYNGLIPGNNQYAEITLYVAGPNGDNAGVFVRLQAPTTYSAYMCRIKGTASGTQIEIRTNGVQTTVLASESSSLWADDDVMRCEANGNIITLYQNGTPLLTSPSDTTYPSGRTGIFATNSGLGIKSFTVGDLAAPAITVRHRVIVFQ